MSCYKMKDIPLSERPRERLLEEGSKNLTNKELLAIILRTGTKNKNATDLALEILKKYQLSDLKQITINELLNINGIGQTKATQIIATIELGKRIFLNKPIGLKKLTNAKSIWEDMKYLFSNLEQECFYCLYFNNNQQLIERKLLFMGTINKSTIHPREIFKEAYRLSASSIVCMHNHPSNNLTHSKADIDLTEKLIKIGYIQGIPIIDHIIVGDDDFYSFYEHNNILNL